MGDSTAEVTPGEPIGLFDKPEQGGPTGRPRASVLLIDHESPTIPPGICDQSFAEQDTRPNRVDAVDAILTESARLAMLALEALKEVKLLPGEAPQWPLPRVRAATLLRCAASILDDLGGPR